MQLSKKVEQLCNLLTENQLVMNDLNDLNQDMKNYLDIRSCLCYQKCKNLTINIDNKINRIILFECENIKLNIGGFVSGLEAKKCSKVELTIKQDGPLNCIVLEKCNDFKVNISKKFIKDTVVELSGSNNLKFFDLDGNKVRIE